MKIRNMCQKYGSKIAYGSAAFFGSIALAHAEGEGASAVFTALQAKATEYEGYAWTLLAVVMTAIIGIKLFKKFSSKAT
ncbi:major coat protein [Shewanella sp. Shew256]|uniref:major coat protein n=1 Tax=Shewanella sp. Shew256 TaxID=1969376 RepID=UPI001C3CF4BF|nr:major coat protein [Shewanella sp. Shew256]